MIDGTLLPALLTLLTVARSGSVGAAARLHHRTSSAVSQQLRKLERQLGVTLLERAGRGVRLTAAGEAALPAVVRVGTEAEALLAHLAELSGRPPATLRVAVSDYLGRALLVPVLRELLEERAPLRFEIVTTHSREAVRLVGLGETDCAVVTGQEVPRGLEAHRLFDQPFVWVAPRRAGHPAPLHERLAREPVLRLGAGSQGRRLLEDYLERERIQPISTIDVPSVSLLLAYVSGGLGVGLAPALALAELDRGRVRWERAAVPALPVALVHRPGFRRAPAAARFADRLIAESRARRATARRARRATPRPGRSSPERAARRARPGGAPRSR
ncbi:MAG TPA: LysR family transcriptional regulator [Methylomirabilota bacterium]|nr:LysR family transcriptional regulator [Methylomirabilota bacterium]